MQKEINSQIEQIKRQLFRIRFCVGGLLILEISRFFPGLNKMLEEKIPSVLLLLAGLVLTIVIVYAIEKLFSPKK